LILAEAMDWKLVLKKLSDKNVKATIPSTDYDIGKQLENLEYFSYIVSMITGERCTWEIKSRIAMAKVAFSKKAVFTS
jgi:hypothetical protein